MSERAPAGEQDFSQETSSITSSIRDHVFVGGLRYHAYHAGKYPFPNDDVEQDRDDMQHNMVVTLCDGKSFYAPVGEVLEGGGEVLDLGKWTNYTH